MWNKTMTMALSGALMLAACAETGETQGDERHDDVLDFATSSARADASAEQIRKLDDGRVVFYGDVADELIALGEAHPYTAYRREAAYTYSQSPFAYCVEGGEESACVSLLPTSGIDEGVFTFGGHFRGLEGGKAVGMIEAMYRLGYDVSRTGNRTEFSADAGPFRCAYQSARAHCSIDLQPARARLRVSFDALPALGEGFVYEGWLIVDGAPVSAGRFDAVDQVAFDFPEEYADAQMYVLTIEPRDGDDPAPSKTHLVAGTFAGGAAELTVDHGAALATEFGDAMGTFILAAPSAAGLDGDFGDKGIWYLVPGGGGPSLDLPMLPEGWEYEGWIVGDDGPISTGRFTDVWSADSDGGGPAAGPAGTPPFPGQDFVNPPMSLVGTLAVISVEPSPDDSPAPFALKPLVGMVEDAGTGTPQMLDRNGEALPTGAATLELR